MKIAVVVASIGRPQRLSAMLECLRGQTKPPFQVVLSVESDKDLPDLGHEPFPVDCIAGPRGLPLQRNRGLDRLLPDADLVVFYDDDFVPSRYSLERIERFFTGFPAIVGADGVVLRDGIKGPGISPETARKIVGEEDDRVGLGVDRMQLRGYKFALYGCNMVYRVSAIRNVRFDERLPLYAWLEDLDFGSRVDGPLANTDAFWGVHCGEKEGRETTGRRLGYSQIVNPVYMLRKGTLPRPFAFKIMARNMAANHLRSLRPEPWVDRKARAAGNWLALKDLMLGRIEPQRILDF